MQLEMEIHILSYKVRIINHESQHQKKQIHSTQNQVCVLPAERDS